MPRCTHCHTQAPDTQRFCGSCGQALIPPAATSSPSSSSSSGASLGMHWLSGGPPAPLLAVKPQYHLHLQLVPGLLMGLFMGLWGAGFMGGISMALLEFLDKTQLIHPWLLFAGCGAAFLVLTPMVMTVACWLVYRRTEYRFYAEHLVYVDGFLTRQEKQVDYRQIRETAFTQGILQQGAGVGNIKLLTSATSANAGITLRDIPDAQRVYRQLQQLMQTQQQHHEPSRV